MTIQPSELNLTILRLVADPAVSDDQRLADEAGIDRATLGAQIRALVSRGLLLRDRRLTTLGQRALAGEDLTPEPDLPPEPQPAPKQERKRSRSGPQTRANLSDTRAAVLEALKSCTEPASSAELRERLAAAGVQIRRRGLHHHLHALSRAGVAELDGFGRASRWSVTSPRNAHTPTPPPAHTPAGWSLVDRVLVALDEYPEGLHNYEVAKVVGSKATRVGTCLSALASRGDAIKVGGHGGKWFASWHAPVEVAA